MSFDEDKNKISIEYNKDGSHFYIVEKEIAPDVFEYRSTKAPEKLDKDQFKTCVKKLYGKRKNLTETDIAHMLNRHPSGVSKTVNDK